MRKKWIFLDGTDVLIMSEFDYIRFYKLAKINDTENYYFEIKTRPNIRFNPIDIVKHHKSEKAKHKALTNGVIQYLEKIISHLKNKSEREKA